MIGRPFRVFVIVALLWGTASAADAQQQPLTLRIDGGRVTLHARNVTVRQILQEWARVGGTRMVNVERVTGAPVSLDLDGVPERQALDVLLRNVAGYVLGARPAPAASQSSIDRVLILASSTAPPPRAVAPQPTFTNGPATRVPRPAFPVVQPQIDPNDPEENPPGDVAPSENVQPQIVRPGIRTGVGVIQPPFGDPPVQPEPEDTTPDNGSVVVSPNNPFGVPRGSSSMPGVVTPVPQTNPQQNTAPRIQDPD